MAVQGLYRFGLLFVLFICSFVIQAADLTIGSYTVEDSSRVSRFEFDYSYYADITNTGPSASNVTATLTSTSPYITVLEGEVTFGDIGVGETLRSGDTFIVRHNRLGPFDESALVWNIVAADNSPPLIGFDSPTGGAAIETTIPTFNISFSDEDSGVDLSSFQLLVNGIDVTASSSLSDVGASHTPASPLEFGDNQATANITDNAGNVSSTSIQFSISVFRAIADCAPVSGQAPLTVSFRSRGEFSAGSLERFRWDYQGDGGFDTNDTVARDYSYTFNSSGTYNSVLEVTNNFGETAQDICTIVVAGEPPVASATVEPSNGPVPLTVTMTGRGSKLDGSIVLHEWDIDGDGIFDYSIDSFFPSTAPPSSITFYMNHANCGSANSFSFYLNGILIGTTSGVGSCTCNSNEPNYTVVDSSLLSNWNSAGANVLRADVGTDIAIAYVRAELNFSAETSQVCVFDDLASGDCGSRGLCEAYDWGGSYSAPADFENLAISTVEHTYTIEGDFNALFRITDDEGQTATASVTTTAISARPPGSPSVSASASPTNGMGPLNVGFNGSATDDGTIVLWEWDFDGDGVFDYSSSSSVSTSYTYENSGVYAAELRATDNNGLTSSALVEIIVNSTATLSVSAGTFDPRLDGSVAINTTLSAGTDVKVLIKDMDGFVVRTLVDETRAAGSYSDSWNGRDTYGVSLPEGSYYAVLEYLSGGELNFVDLTNSTGGGRYNPPRSRIPSSFSPFSGDPLDITFTLYRASEVTAFIGRFYSNNRLVTFLERVPLGSGTHTITWNGENAEGQLIHPPSGDRFLFGIWGYYLADNAIYLRSGAHVSSLSISPPIFDPSGHIDDQGTPENSQVTFSLSSSANVELVVSDADTGKVVARRLFNNLPAGSNTVGWDGEDDSGVYVAPGRYRLGVAAIDANGFRSIRIYALQRIYY